MAEGGGHIGLNEVAIGISVPLFWARLMARVVGQATAERLCQFASLVGPREAKEVRHCLAGGCLSPSTVCRVPVPVRPDGPNGGQEGSSEEPPLAVFTTVSDNANVPVCTAC